MDKERLNEMSDFQDKYIYRVPFLKFSGRKGNYSKAGEFTLLDQDKEGNIVPKSYGNSIDVVFLKRGKFRLEGESFVSAEGMPNQNKNVNIYQMGKQGNRRLIDSGPWQTMKQRYGLKTSQFPYVLIVQDDIVARLKVLPGSLSRYWNYLASFKGKEKPYDYITALGSVEVEGNKGTYCEMTFEAKERSDIERIAERIREVSDNVRRMEESLERTEEDFIKNQEAIPEPIENELPPEVGDEQITPESIGA